MNPDPESPNPQDLFEDGAIGDLRSAVAEGGLLRRGGGEGRALVARPERHSEVEALGGGELGVGVRI